MMIKHYPVAGMTTPSLDALPTPSNHAPDQTPNGSLIDVIRFLYQGLCLGSVRFEVGSNDVKLVVGACLTDVLLGSNPVIELATS